MAVAALSGARSSSCLLYRLFKMSADIQTTVTGLKVVLMAGWPAVSPSLSCKAGRAARERTEAVHPPRSLFTPRKVSFRSSRSEDLKNTPFLLTVRVTILTML